MSLSELLQNNHNDLTDHDLAHLADWATVQKDNTPNPAWKRAYALIREGADLLLRRRAMSTTAGGNLAVRPTVDYPELRAVLNDYTTVFYGPHDCPACGNLVVRAALEKGGAMYDADALATAHRHRCGSKGR